MPRHTTAEVFLGKEISKNSQFPQKATFNGSAEDPMDPFGPNVSLERF